MTAAVRSSVHAEPEQTLGEADWAVWRGFMALGAQLQRALDRQLQRDSGISHPDYLVLLTLFEAEDHRLRIGALAEVMAWEKSRVSHQVSRMSGRGLVARRLCDADGRGTWVEITNQGRRVILGAMRQHIATIQELFFDGLSDDEKRVLRRLSERMLTRLNPVACDIVGAGAGGSDPAPAAAATSA